MGRFGLGHCVDFGREGGFARYDAMSSRITTALSALATLAPDDEPDVNPVVAEWLILTRIIAKAPRPGAYSLAAWGR